MSSNNAAGPNLHPDLARLRERYEQLVADTSAGHLPPQEAFRLLGQLGVTDAEGAMWSIDPEGHFTRRRTPLDQPERCPAGLFSAVSPPGMVASPFGPGVAPPVSAPVPGGGVRIPPERSLPDSNHMPPRPVAPAGPAPMPPRPFAPTQAPPGPMPPGAMPPGMMPQGMPPGSMPQGMPAQRPAGDPIQGGVHQNPIGQPSQGSPGTWDESQGSGTPSGIGIRSRHKPKRSRDGMLPSGIVVFLKRNTATAIVLAIIAVLVAGAALTRNATPVGEATTTTAAAASTVATTAAKAGSLPTADDASRVIAALKGGQSTATAVLVSPGTASSAALEASKWAGMGASGFEVKPQPAAASGTGAVQRWSVVDAATGKEVSAVKVEWVKEGGGWKLKTWPQAA